MPANQANLPLRKTRIQTSRAAIQLKNASVQGKRAGKRTTSSLANKKSSQKIQQESQTSEKQESLSQSPKNDSTNSAEAFRKWIELEVLKIMKQQIEKSDVSQQRIQDMANRTLDMIQPNMSVEQLFHSAIELNDGYPEFDSLTIKLIKEYEHKYKGKAVERVSELVRTGSLDEAQNVVKKVLEFKML